MKKILICLILMAGVAQGQTIGYNISNYYLRSSTGTTNGGIIGMPRQQMVCIDTAGWIAVRYDYGSVRYDSLMTSYNRGATWSQAVRMLDRQTNRHAHLQIWNDTIYDFDGHSSTEDSFRTAIFTPDGSTRVFQGEYDTLGYSDPASGIIWDGVPTGTANQMVGVIRDGYDAGQYWISDNRGRTWNNQHAEVTSLGSVRIGMFPMDDSAAFTVYVSESVRQYFFNAGDSTWTYFNSAPTMTDVDYRTWMSIWARDTIWTVGVAGVQPQDTGITSYRVTYVPRAGGTPHYDTMATFNNLHVGSPEYIGYCTITDIASLPGIGVFYTRTTDGSRTMDSLRLYFRLWYNGQWEPEQLVNNNICSGGLSGPFKVPISHGHYAYAMIRLGSTAGAQICAVEITGISQESPTCSLSTTLINFVNVNTGSTKDDTFYITNTGGGTLTGTVVDTCTPFSIVSGGTLYSLTYGQSEEVIVRFSPTATGVQSCYLDMGDNAACAQVLLYGVGTASGSSAKGKIILGYKDEDE